MLRPNSRPLATWGIRLIAGLLTLALGLPLAAVALAQATGPTITITGVDSTNYPTVSTSLTVTGNNGLPLVGLTASNFSVTEDGRSVAPGSLVLNSDIGQPLDLILAIDISTSGNDLAQIISAANDFVATLGPNDQVAILAFYDKVDVVQGFTSDKTTLTTALDNMNAGGNGTVFNQAADQAVNLLSALPAGRKAVVMFTNSGDTANNLSPENTLANAQTAKVRIFPMAFGGSVNASLMRNWARFSGGQAYLLANSTEIRPNLLTLGVLLRQSYKLSFKSGLVADNKTHAISVNLSYQGLSAQAQGSYAAVPGQVTVVGPGLTNGQTVRGRVFLVAEVTAPASVKAVTFQLDGRDLVTLAAAPYRFDWDSASASPGLHTLTVKALDTVGNEGQSQVTVNVVLPPVAVVTATPVRAVATAQAQAEQSNPVKTIQSTAVKALPAVGRVLGGVAILVAALIALVLWLLTLRSQREVQVKECAVEIANEGNSRSRYELRAEDPSGNLKFEFMVNDTDLAQRVGVPVGSAAATTAVAARGPAAPEEKHPNATVAKAKETWAKTQELENKAVATVGYGSLISNWIVTISYLLPGTLGESLRESTAGMRSTQYEVRNVVDAPGRYQRMVNAAAPPRFGANPNAPLNTGNPVSVAWPKTSTAGNGASAQTATAQPKTVVARTGWSLTPPVDAGGSLTVQLKIRPARFPRAQHYGFQVLSRSVDGNEELLVTEQGSVALRRGPIVRRILGWVLLAATLILLLLFIIYVLSSVGLIR